jgi:hypothetical protein
MTSLMQLEGIDTIEKYNTSLPKEFINYNDIAFVRIMANYPVFDLRTHSCIILQ